MLQLLVPYEGQYAFSLEGFSREANDGVHNAETAEVAAKVATRARGGGAVVGIAMVGTAAKGSSKRSHEVRGDGLDLVPQIALSMQ